MTYRTDNPIADFNRYQAEQEKQLTKCSICAECEEYIQDDYYYEINGDILCCDCMDNYYRRSTDDYIEMREYEYAEHDDYCEE